MMVDIMSMRIAGNENIFIIRYMRGRQDEMIIYRSHTMDNRCNPPSTRSCSTVSIHHIHYLAQPTIQDRFDSLDFSRRLKT